MDLSLSQIKNILEFDDFNKIVDYLKEAEQNANRKIEELNSIKVKIERARRFYESKLTNESNSNEKTFVIKQKSRVIMLADKLSSPTFENLWNYHRHFYEQVGEKIRISLSLKMLQEFMSQMARQTCLQYAQNMLILMG